MPGPARAALDLQDPGYLAHMPTGAGQGASNPAGDGPSGPKDPRGPRVEGEEAVQTPEETPTAQEKPAPPGIEPAGRPGTIEMPRPRRPAADPEPAPVDPEPAPVDPEAAAPLPPAAQPADEVPEEPEAGTPEPQEARTGERPTSEEPVPEETEPDVAETGELGDPEVSETGEPDPEAPETGELGDPEVAETREPDPEAPETGELGDPEVAETREPDPEAPETGELGDPEVAETGELGDPEVPETGEADPEVPETGEPKSEPETGEPDAEEPESEDPAPGEPRTERPGYEPPAPADQTRRDLPLPLITPPAPRRSPEQSGYEQPDAPAPRGERPAPPLRAESPAPLPSPPPLAPPERQRPGWHRHHYPIGVFLLTFGLTGLLSSLIGWDDRRSDIAGYLTETAGLGTGLATPVLILVKTVQLLLFVAVLGGMLRRKDVWLLPALVGWMIGFAVFCVLDVWAGFMGRLVEHLVSLLVLTLLLFVSYTLSVKVRIGRAAPPAPPQAGEPPARNLTRTQEMALAALSRWQRGTGQDARNGPAHAGPPNPGPPHSGPS
ncbi:hypothetical protein GCM10009780_35300 [Actinomadura alba]